MVLFYQVKAWICGHQDTIDQGHRKVFTTGQARFNPEHYVIKMRGQMISFYTHMASLSLAVCCSKSIKPTNHFSTLFIT